MSEDHNHPHGHDHQHGPEKPAPAPLEQDDTGSRALSDALRSSFFIVKIVMVVLVALFFGSGFFTVNPQEKAVILRFGKPVGEGEQALLGPGFHWSFPAPIDEVVRIPIGQIRSVSSSVGWYLTAPELEAAKTEPPPGPALNPALDGYVLTGDANIIHARATLRYRVTDPLQNTFAFTSASNLVQNALNNALFFAAAQFTVDNALTRDVTGFRERVRARVTQLLEQQQLGVTVEQSDVQVIPPRQLKDKFNAVLEAGVKRDKALNEARSYENEILSKARGEAASRINTGETERTRLVEFVAAEAKKFSDLLPEYRKDPELFFRLRQTETLARVLANAQEKIFVAARPDGKPRELRITIGREPEKRRLPEPPKKPDAH